MFFLAPSEPPLDIILVSVNSMYIELSWKFPELENRNGVIRYFVVNITNFQNNEMSLFNSTSTLFLAYDLHPYSTYFLSIAAVTISMGPFSKEISVTTLQDGMFQLAVYIYVSCYNNTLS